MQCQVFLAFSWFLPNLDSVLWVPRKWWPGLRLCIPSCRHSAWHTLGVNTFLKLIKLNFESSINLTCILPNVFYISFFCLPDFSCSSFLSLPSLFFSFPLFVCSLLQCPIWPEKDQAGNWTVKKLNSSSPFSCLPSLLLLFPFPLYTPGVLLLHPKSSVLKH